MSIIYAIAGSLFGLGVHFLVSLQPVAIGPVRVVFNPLPAPLYVVVLVLVVVTLAVFAIKD